MANTKDKTDLGTKLSQAKKFLEGKRRQLKIIKTNGCNPTFVIRYKQWQLEMSLKIEEVRTLEAEVAALEAQHLNYNRINHN